MRLSLTRLLLILSISAATGGAQAPPPAMLGGSLSGIVRDQSGAPIESATLTLVGQVVGTRTDAAGRFVLRDIEAGSQVALFRRLGYQSVEHRWVVRAGAELQISVVMTPLPQELAGMVAEMPGTSRRRGTSSIGGSVVDSAGDAVENADVRLLGAGLSTVTDAEGRFEFRMLAAGPYILRVRKHGLRTGNNVMQIADDDHRRTTMKLFGLPGRVGAKDTATASGFGIGDRGFAEFDRRNQSAASVVLGPADLFRADGKSLEFVLEQYRDVAALQRRQSSIVREGVGSTTEGDCLLIDGKRAVYQPLRTYSSRDVLLVEAFRPNAFVDAYIVSNMDLLPQCRGSSDHHPGYFVLWMRSLR